MSDGSIKIDTKIDTKGVDKDLKDLDSKLKKGKKSADNFLGSFTKFTAVGAGAAIALKKVAETIGEMTDAYKVQARAETQLESAAKNNPYLNNASVVALKNYASEIQSYSTYGDEELIPMMAKLAAGGRTQTEIMEIMTVATDMAASGAFSLDSAVSNLNKSFGGLSGELGESIPEIKALTTEQLKNGEAVKLLGSRYKGIAVDVAKATGTSEQLANAMGDLKEEFGATFEKSLSPMRRFFTELISNYAAVKKAKREAIESSEDVAAGGGTLDEIATEILKAEKEVATLKAKFESSALSIMKSHLGANEYKKFIESLENQLKEANARVTRYTIQFSKTQEEEKTKAIEEEAKKVANTSAERDKQATEHIKLVTEERKKAIAVLKAQADAEGKQVDAQDELNAYIASYVKLITESNGSITASNPIAQELLDTIQKRTQAIQKEIDAEEKLNAQKKANEKEKDRIAELAKKNKQKLEDSVKSILDEAMSEKEVIAQEMELLELQYAQLTTDEQLKIQEDYNRAYELLKEKEVQINKDAEEQKRTQSIQSAQKIISTANDFATQYMNIQKTITDMATQAVEAETAIKSLELEKQYASGAVSLEEYEKKKLEIEKEAAQKKYKLDMWEWTSSVLSATSSTALAVVKALEAGPILGPIMAGLIGAAGAAQLVSIMASKPIPPQFAEGGVVPGNSYTGDKMIISTNSAERVLTAQQNAAFEKLAYGQTTQSGTNIKIYNSASNDVSAKPEISEGEILIMIEKTVSKQMESGKYNSAFKTMQGGLNGVRYTN